MFSECPNIASAKIRPNFCRLEMEVHSPHTDNSQALSATTLSSTKVPMQTNMGVGVFQNGEFHINPVKTVVQMRPSFEKLKAREVIEDMSSGDEDDDNEVSGSAPLQQVHLRRKESDRVETSRAHSYSYLQAQEESDPWIPLRVHDPGTCGVPSYDLPCAIMNCK